ncbi:MAG: phosphate ABC transporter permease subunit PstC [Deltaproteobacteria bacterium RIFCSPHIGHO2_02_FULL_40_11]|nr:MAG: phosphate ABC transporter permease subunit PstC [Deltaproteobacteria bacterium RIFCSPHIGHO2_02_FULL_40_11]
MIKALLFFCGMVSVLTTLGIVGILVFETWGFFQHVSFKQFFGDTQWTPLFTNQHFGIWALVSGTVLTSAVAIGTALPLGLLAAIYLSEFATKNFRLFVKPALEVLAGIPTVIYGYFALTFMTPFLQNFIPGLSGFNALGAGIVMGMMILPIIASLSEDAIYAVPPSLKEGAYALGANKLATIFKVVLPSSFSGIAAATILAISRAIGETMIVVIAAGQQPNFSFDPREAIQTMTAYIVQVSLGDTPTGTLAYQTIFAVGMTLFLFTLLLNLFAHHLRRRILKGHL